MIIVNVGRSWPKAQSEEARTDAVESGWPIRGATLPPATGEEAEQLATFFGGRARNAAMLEDIVRVSGGCDYLVAVSSNTVVDVRYVDHWNVFDDHFAFKTSAPDWRSAVVGTRLPADLAWQRGESWPLKVADSAWLLEAIKTESVTLGPYAVHLLPTGNLHVTLPSTGGLVTVGAYDQAVPVSTPRVVRDPEADYFEREDQEKRENQAWEAQQAARGRRDGSRR